MSITPWAKEISRQVRGRQFESDYLKAVGAIAHPNSGAGRIKDDGHDDEDLIEVKFVGRQHAINGINLKALFQRATRQGKRARYVIYFEDDDLLLTGYVTKGAPSEGWPLQG